MKQEFEMTEEELQAIYDISRNQTPVIYVGTWHGLDSQEQANRLWQLMADKYGFIWDTVEGSAKGKRFFLAVPKTIVFQKTQEEIELEKYDTLQKIIDQLEFCNYQTEDGLHLLKDNIAFKALNKLAARP